jgi:hypothetical protein
MKKKLGLSLLAALATVALAATASVQAQVASMTFFVTSVGKGNGADLGGLEGADAHCAALVSFGILVACDGMAVKAPAFCIGSWWTRS